MIPDVNDSVNDSVPVTKNTNFICGVVEGSAVFFMYILVHVSWIRLNLDNVWPLAVDGFAGYLLSSEDCLALLGLLLSLATGFY